MKPHTLRPLLAVALGLAVTWLWEIAVGGLPVAGYTLHPGIVAYVALAVMALPVVWKEAAPASQSAWFFASAVALAELPLLVTRGSQRSELTRDLGIGTLIALALLLPSAFFGRNRARPRLASPWAAAGVWALAVLTIGACQGGNRLARIQGIPNSERSLMIGGFEIHHLNFGVLLLVTAVILLSRCSFPLLWRRLLLALVGLAVGLIADEWLYYAAAEVTDRAYFQPLTWQSALLLSLALLVTWYAWARNDRRRAAGT